MVNFSILQMCLSTKAAIFSFFERNRKAILFYISNSSEVIMNKDNHLSTSEVS